MPFLKCSSNPSQTINAKTNKKSKTAVTKKIALEAFERFGNDPDINKDESNKNIYLTNIESTEEYLELIEKTKEKINEQLVSKNKKKLRKDTVDTIALVVKPSYDSMKQLTYDEQVKFLKDSKVVIEDIFCQYINPNFKFDGAIIHFDEINPHLHCLGMPTIIDETTGIETFNAKKFLSLKNITHLNRNYSTKMQELGWNVKDFELYEDMTSEEKEEHKKSKKNYGRDSLQFKKEEKQKLEQQISNLDNLKKEVVEKLTKDKNGHVILGDETKTGRYKGLKGKKDIRYIPFALFDSSILTHILENQIKIAKENKYNKNHLLFCQKDGQVISHIGINSIFKRICREAKIKLELDTGCHFHMTRHTAITRLIEMGTDPMVIASWVGHTNTRQIEETYGHILQNFKNWQLENPGKYYKKEDLITKEIKRLLLNL